MFISSLPYWRCNWHGCQHWLWSCTVCVSIAVNCRPTAIWLDIRWNFLVMVIGYIIHDRGHNVCRLKWWVDHTLVSTICLSIFGGDDMWRYVALLPVTTALSHVSCKRILTLSPTLGDCRYFALLSYKCFWDCWRLARLDLSWTTLGLSAFAAHSNLSRSRRLIIICAGEYWLPDNDVFRYCSNAICWSAPSSWSSRDCWMAYCRWLFPVVFHVLPESVSVLL